MSIDLALPKKEPFTNKKFKLTESTSVTLEKYVKAAQEKFEADEDSVVEAILKKHFQKDRTFQQWLKASVKNEQQDC